MNFTIKQISHLVSEAFKPVAAKMKELAALTDKLLNDTADNNKVITGALQDVKKQSELINKITDHQKSQTLANSDFNKALSNKVNIEKFAEQMADFRKRHLMNTELYSKNTRYKPGETVTKNGGVYQAINETSSEPGLTANWLLIQNGIKSFEANETGFTIELTNNEIIKLDDLKGAPGDGLNFKGLHVLGDQYELNDICVTDGAAWIATKETKNSPPLDGWKLFVKRGPRGKEGKQGPGIDDHQLKNLIDDNFDQIIVKDIQPLIQKAFDQAVNSAMKWRGAWNENERYTMGDVIRSDNALYVAITSNQGQPPSTTPGSWSFILRNSKGRAGGGGSSGVTSVDGRTGEVTLNDLYTNENYVNNQIAAIDFPVDSVFGRMGAVVADQDDYTATQIFFDNATTGTAATNVQQAIDDNFLLLFQYSSLRTSVLTSQTFTDVTHDIIDIFDELTKESLFVTGDELLNTQTVNVDGYYEVTIALNVEFPGNEELNVYTYVDGIAYSSNPISLRGQGAGNPTELIWTSLMALSAGNVIDMRGSNGIVGSFSCQFIRSRFMVQFKGAL